MQLFTPKGVGGGGSVGVVAVRKELINEGRGREGDGVGAWGQSAGSTLTEDRKRIKNKKTATRRDLKRAQTARENRRGNARAENCNFTSRSRASACV